MRALRAILVGLTAAGLLLGLGGCNQPPPPPPTELTAEAQAPFGEGGIRLAWKPIDSELGLTELLLERQDYDGAVSPETLASLDPTAVEYIDDSAKPGVRWQYTLKGRRDPNAEPTVIAVYALGRTADDEEPPAPPTNLEAEDRALDQPSGINISFEPSPDELGGAEDVVAYRVYRVTASNGEKGDLIATLPAQVTRHVDEDVTVGQAYSYRVTAHDGVNESEAALSEVVVVVDNARDVLVATLLNYLRTILALAFTLGLAIMAHEFGHMMLAKWSGMKVDEFAIGFGKAIWSRETPDTLYTLRLVPLGGFVRIRGMTPEEVDDPDGLYAKPVLARFLVMVGGAAFNVILAFVLYAAIASVWSPGSQVQIDRVRDGSVAAAAGLEPGDLLIAVDGRRYAGHVQTIGAIARSPGREIELTVRRGEETFKVPVVPEATPAGRMESLLYALDDPTVRGIIGIDNKPVPIERTLNPIEVLSWAGRHVREGMGSLTVLLTKMIARPETAKDSVGGPIMIAQAVHEVQQEGVEQIIGLTAYLSLCFAFFNLLPIPMLDGSKAIIVLVEGIRGRLFDKEREAMFHFVGLVALLMLAFFVAYMDVSRITGNGWVQ